MPALSAKTKHYYRERVRSVLVQNPMISGEGIRRHLEMQGLVIDRHYVNKLVNEIHVERANRANTWMLNHALASLQDQMSEIVVKAWEIVNDPMAKNMDKTMAMREIREANTVDRILRNLRFDLGQRKVLLVFDEAQHLSIECLETLRELLDQPPHCGLLFAGTHELEAIFTRQALELEQWRSRFHAGQALPGISEEEAATIVHSELGLGLSQRKIQKLISKSRITNLRNGGQHSYVSARRLFWVIRELQAVANGALAHTRHHE